MYGVELPAAERAARHKALVTAVSAYDRLLDADGPYAVGAFTIADARSPAVASTSSNSAWNRMSRHGCDGRSPKPTRAGPGQGSWKPRSRINLKSMAERQSQRALSRETGRPACGGSVVWVGRLLCIGAEPERAVKAGVLPIG